LRSLELETRQELETVRIQIDERDELVCKLRYAECFWLIIFTKRLLRAEVEESEGKVSKMSDMSSEIQALEQELSLARKQSEEALIQMKYAQDKSLQLQVELQNHKRNAEQFKQLLSEHEAESESCINELRSELTRIHAQFTEASGESNHLNRLLQDSLERGRIQKQTIDRKEGDMQGEISLKCATSESYFKLHRYAVDYPEPRGER
jgi:hypothetical protein